MKISYEHRRHVYQSNTCLAPHRGRLADDRRTRNTPAERHVHETQEQEQAEHSVAARTGGGERGGEICGGYDGSM